MKNRAITHLNIIGFRAAVAAVKDKSLKGRPFVIAGAAGGRSLALDCSPEAVRQGVIPGMPVTAAERQIKDLQVLLPDPAAYDVMNGELEKMAARYAPVWENDKAGNIYLDITGTTRIFGSPADCSGRLLRDISEQVDLRPAAALACNKLVSKVATRTIRPAGFIQIHAGTEAEFFEHQDIKILPGMGAKLILTASAAGIREIGEIAALSVQEAIALFGKHGRMLRDMALGIDNSAVQNRGEEKRIIKQADFNEDTIDEIITRSAIHILAENGGLEMRRNKLGSANIVLSLLYADGIKAEGQELFKRICFLDRDIAIAAERIYQKINVRRIRLRGLCLMLEKLTPLGFQPDLFEPETEIKQRKMQEAVDKIQNRFGAGKITKGLILAASPAHNNMRFLTASTGYAN